MEVLMRLFAWAAVALPCMASPAFAHAFLVRANPPVGAALHDAPSAVTVIFTEAVEPAFSTIEVDGPAGKVAAGAPYAAQGGRVLSVSVPKLGPGTYTVIWHATSVDTHKTEGKFTFTVIP
jgi:methionine-rich copper-binding protein CopC